jgi:hypothetical protein
VAPHSAVFSNLRSFIIFYKKTIGWQPFLSSFTFYVSLIIMFLAVRCKFITFAFHIFRLSIPEMFTSCTFYVVQVIPIYLVRILSPLQYVWFFLVLMFLNKLLELWQLLLTFVISKNIFG